MKWILTVFVFLAAGCSSSPRAAQSGLRNNKPPIMDAHLPSGPKKALPVGSPEAHYQSGVRFLQARDYQAAFEQFSIAQKLWQGESRESDAIWGAIRTGTRIGRYQETYELTQKLLKVGNWSPQALSEIYSIQYRSTMGLNNSMATLDVVKSVLANPALEAEHETYRYRAVEIVQSRLDAKQLDDFAEDSSDRMLKAQAYFRLAELSLETRDQSAARSYFAKSYNQSPESDIGVQARQMLEQLEAARRVDPQTIGVVLPLSGRYASIAQKSLRGIQLGLGLNGQSSSSFKLAVADSGGNPDGARRGVERLVKEDNAIALIGSLESRTAPTVAAKSSELNVPSIGLSQKAGLTDVGPSVFRNALTSEMQIRYLVRTAMEDLGLQKFAVLFPNDQYGVEFANLFWDEVLARGGQITAAQSYKPNETDFNSSIQRLVGTYYIEDRKEEYKLKLKEWEAAQSKKTARTQVPTDLLAPVVNFDAIFIPDNTKTLGQIAAMLSYNNVKGVRLLGTNIWNTPSLARRLTNLSHPILFVDADTKAATASQFVKEFRALYKEEPGIFELQGYDSALILRHLITQGRTDRESLALGLQQLQDFPGVIGKLTMSEEREVLRPLAALTLESGEIKAFQRGRMQ